MAATIVVIVLVNKLGTMTKKIVAKRLLLGRFKDVLFSMTSWDGWLTCAKVFQRGGEAPPVMASTDGLLHAGLHTCYHG